jgi:hypothetical protein
MSARALLPLIILSVLLGSLGSATSAGAAAPIVERPISSARPAPSTPIIKPSGSGPQKEAPDTKPKKDPLPRARLSSPIVWLAATRAMDRWSGS